MRKSASEMKCLPRVPCLRLFKSGERPYLCFVSLGCKETEEAWKVGRSSWRVHVCVCVHGKLSPVPHLTPGRQERASWGGRRWGRACFSQVPPSISPFQARILVLDNLGVGEGTAAVTSAN